jgi:hypothetical protein
MVHYYRHRSDHLCSRFSFQDMHAASPRSNEPSLPGTWTRIYLDLFDYYDSSTGSLEIDYLIWDKKRVKHMHVGNIFFSRTCVARVALREEKRRYSIGRGETPRSDEQATKRTTHALHMTCRPAQLYTTTQSSGRCLPPRRSAYTKQLGKPSRFAATRRAKLPTRLTSRRLYAGVYQHVSLIATTSPQCPSPGSDQVPAELPQHLEPDFSADDASEEQVVDRLLLLRAQGAGSMVRKPMAQQAIRRPAPAE